MMVRLLLIFLIITTSLHAQNDSTYTFNDHVNSVYGDLNKDGLIDLAVVYQDTTHENAPYILEVYLKQSNGDLKLVASSTKVIEPQFPNGREMHMWGSGFDQLSIHDGILWVETGFIRGHMEHKFRFQNGRFELIGYKYVNADLGTIYIIDYNLSTGRRIEKKGAIGDDTYKVTLDEVIKINPLPNLNTFEPNAEGLY